MNPDGHTKLEVPVPATKTLKSKCCEKDSFSVYVPAEEKQCDQPGWQSCYLESERIASITLSFPAMALKELFSLGVMMVHGFDKCLDSDELEDDADKLDYDVNIREERKRFLNAVRGSKALRQKCALAEMELTDNAALSMFLDEIQVR